MLLPTRTFAACPRYSLCRHQRPLLYFNSFSSPSTQGPAKRDSSDGPTSTLDKDLELPPATKVLHLQNSLQRWSITITSYIRAYADHFTASAKTAFSQLGSQLNKATGYDEIEALKRKVVDQEARIDKARQVAREAKFAYEQAALRRSKSQREVNTLIPRTSDWTEADMNRFTSLVRQDHLLEQEEARTKIQAQESEATVDQELSELLRSILARYHEEQVWSDKIRSASTYGSLTALGLNMLVFILAILIVEPWKRRRLAQTFEAKVEELSKETAQLIDARIGKFATLLEHQSTATSLKAVALSEPPISDLSPQGASKLDSSSLLDNLEVRKALAACAIVAGAAGWFLRVWFDR